MIVPDIDNINHVGMAVRDLRDTTSRYERLGFQLTPFSPHSGAWKPGEAVQKLNSGNRCVMFATNYLEILASEDPAAPAPRIENFLKHHQGGCIICFNSEDVQAADGRLVASGVKTSGVIPLQRDIDTPDGVRTAKFERVQFAPEDSPEGYIQVARHLTPQHIYQPRYIAHANGCNRLNDTFVITDDLKHFVEKYTRYVGAAAQWDGDDCAVFRFELGARLLIGSSRRMAHMLPGTLFPPVPGIAAVSFNTPDLATQRRRLMQAKVPFNEAEGRIVVPAEEASGIAVVFDHRP